MRAMVPRDASAPELEPLEPYLLVPFRHAEKQKSELAAMADGLDALRFDNG